MKSLSIALRVKSLVVTNVKCIALLQLVQNRNAFGNTKIGRNNKGSKRQLQNKLRCHLLPDIFYALNNLRTSSSLSSLTFSRRIPISTFLD